MAVIDTDMRSARLRVPLMHTPVPALTVGSQAPGDVGVSCEREVARRLRTRRTEQGGGTRMS